MASILGNACVRTGELVLLGDRRWGAESHGMPNITLIPLSPDITFKVSGGLDVLIVISLMFKSQPIEHPRVCHNAGVSTKRRGEEGYMSSW